MGHRALVAYERTDGTYNLHYSHWDGATLRLKHRITEETPFGEGSATEHARETYRSRIHGGQRSAPNEDNPNGLYEVRTQPETTGVTFREALVDHLDYQHHEAFYTVDREFDVTAYRTLWFGLQFESNTVETHPYVGFGAIRTVRWYDGEPVDDGYVRGEFAGMKRIIGKMVDRGVFDDRTALEYLKGQVAAMTDTTRKLHFGTLE